MPRQTNIQIRRGAASDWSTANPVLSQGEIALESDTKKIKVGDGTTQWNSLKYVSFDGGSLESNMVTAPTSVGTNVQVNIINQSSDNVGLSLNFSNVDTQGSTSVIPLTTTYGNPNLPGNFSLSDSLGSFQISTTATFSGNVLVKFVLPEDITQSAFDSIRIFKLSNGVTTDVTVLNGANAPNYATRSIWARVDGFSIFFVLFAAAAISSEPWGVWRIEYSYCTASGIRKESWVRPCIFEKYGNPQSRPPGIAPGVDLSGPGLADHNCFKSRGHCVEPTLDTSQSRKTEDWTENEGGEPPAGLSPQQRTAGNGAWTKTRSETVPYQVSENHHCNCVMEGRLYACLESPFITAKCTKGGGVVVNGPCKARCCDSTNHSCEDKNGPYQSWECGPTLNYSFADGILCDTPTLVWMCKGDNLGCGQCRNDLAPGCFTNPGDFPLCSSWRPLPDTSRQGATEGECNNLCGKNVTYWKCVSGGVCAPATTIEIGGKIPDDGYENDSCGGNCSDD